MKKLWLLLLAAALCLALCACGGSKEESGSSPATEPVPAENGSPAAESLPEPGITYAGAELTCVFEANATTGFSWQSEISDPAILTLTTDEYLTGQNAEGQTGVGGVQRYVFTAAADGQTTVRFWYSQPWDEQAEPAEDKTVTVTVEGGQIVGLE